MATHQSPTDLRPVLSPRDQDRRVSDEEFAEADFLEPWKYEREQGRLVVMAPDGQQHNEGSRPWRRLLSDYWSDHLDLIEDVVPNAWVRVEGGTDRIGDIGIYLVTHAPVPLIPDRVPDIMFEIVSPGREARDRDYIQKRSDYQRLGIREYVIIDRFASRVTVLTLAPDGYEERVLSLADTYTTPLLPGLAIPLAEVL